MMCSVKMNEFCGLTFNVKITLSPGTTIIIPFILFSFSPAISVTDADTDYFVK